MNLEQFREFCLSFDGVTEKMPFGKFARRYESLLVFYVLNHMFCIIDIEDFTYVCLPASTEEIKQLQLSYPDIGKPINRAMRNWINIPLNGSVSHQVLLDLIRRSYILIQEKYTSKPHKGKSDKKSQKSL